MGAFLNLTKPRISLLFAISGLAALLIQKPAWTGMQLGLVVLAIFLIGGSANSFNQYFERDVDRLMTRTASKRPLPLGQVTPRAALVFSILIGAVGSFILLYWGGFLAALLGIATILFYAFFYTLWLKPRTPYNIVIGGAAGAAGPLIAAAAGTGTIGLAPLILFLIIFFWTPPHFWALALCCKEDYAKVGYPMLPLVAGDDATRRQMLTYTLALAPLSLLLYGTGSVGTVYLVAAVVLNLIFILGAVKLYRNKTTRTAWQLFGFSIAYLLLLFIAIITDRLIA